MSRDMRRAGTVLGIGGLVGIIGVYALATYAGLVAAVAFDAVLIAAYVGFTAWETRPCRCQACESGDGPR